MDMTMGANRIDLYTLDNADGDYLAHDVHGAGEAALVWLGESSAQAFADAVGAAWRGEDSPAWRVAYALDRDVLGARLMRHPAERILQRMGIEGVEHICLDFPHNPRVLTVEEFKGFVRGLTGAPVGGIEVHEKAESWR